MFIRRANKQNAAATVEYMALIFFVLAVFLVFQRYIYRGFAGGWKKAGDTFGFGRQYDPRPYGVAGAGGGSLECFFDYTHCQPGILPPCSNVQRINDWIDKRCTQVKHCDCTLPAEDPQYDVRCSQCYVSCPCGS